MLLENFDTSAMVRKLEGAGLEREQAEAVVETSQQVLAVTDKKLQAVATESFVKSELAAVRNEIADVKGEVMDLKGVIGDVRGEIGGVRGEIGGVRGEIGGVRGEIGGVRGEIGGVRGEIGRLESDLKVFFATWLVGGLATMITILGVLLGFFA